MTYVRGDSCYILDEENNIIMAKVVGQKETAIFWNVSAYAELFLKKQRICSVPRRKRK